MVKNKKEAENLKILQRFSYEPINASKANKIFDNFVFSLFCLEADRLEFVEAMVTMTERILSGEDSARIGRVQHLWSDMLNRNIGVWYSPKEKPHEVFEIENIGNPELKKSLEARITKIIKA